jgi:hypothetical protein
MAAARSGGKKSALDMPGRDRSEISRKHGDTLVRILREVYGAWFAPGCADDDKLSDVLHKLDEPSLSQLLHDNHTGHLEGRIRGHF